jgi:2-octaprenyl-6-methoxyphenol hydroxylase
VSEAPHDRVIVVGPGPAGLVTALAFARQGVKATLIGESTPEARGRTVALFDGSVRFLAELGVWDGLAAEAAPLRRLRIVDDTGNLFRWPELCFEASEIGLDAFGWNIGAQALSAALRRAAEREAAIRVIEGSAGAPSFGDAGPAHHSRSNIASVAVGDLRIEAPLIVAADGQRSLLRRAAGMAARLEPLRQAAVIAILRHELPHADGSTEFHKRGGPCTLVPFAAGSPEPADFPYASSLVWMMEPRAAGRLERLDDEAFAAAVEAAVHSILGKMQVASPRGAVPLANLHVARIVAQRLALVGEAAHAFPPIGAQGLNLGLRDAAALARHVGEALRQGRDIGGMDVLDGYDRDRRPDIATRSAAIGMMNRSLLSPFLPVDLARGLGMAALDLVGPLRRLAMREGVEPGFGRRSQGG